jgi:DNA (cytosine-5)-methyltransferase 1
MEKRDRKHCSSAVSVTGGSLFSGIGGLELGAYMAGLEVDWKWQVEIDEFCRRVLERRFPECNRSVVDVTQAGSRNLPRVDVMCGGFPCQDLSTAGRGAGLAGERSGLFYEYARIIRELRPRVVLFENVSALLARGLGSVLAELSACGYDAEWDCIPASAVGAPHQRDRIWIIAYPNSQRLRQQSIDERGCGGETESDGNGKARDAYIDADSERLPDDEGCGSQSRRRGQPNQDGAQESPSWSRCGGWQPASAVRRVDDGFSEGVDRPRARRRRDIKRLKALGNAVVPQASVPAWRRIAEILEAGKC